MNKHHPYRDLYEKYMSYSSFEDFLISDNVSFKARLYHLLITKYSYLFSKFIKPSYFLKSHEKRIKNFYKK